MYVICNSIGLVSSDPVIHQPDAVGIDDGYRPYVVFFCLSWFQKKKKPQPQPVVYDDEFDGDDDEEEENVPVPVAVPPRYNYLIRSQKSLTNVVFQGARRG
jgi:hypothetical protein